MYSKGIMAVDTSLIYTDSMRNRQQTRSLPHVAPGPLPWATKTPLLPGRWLFLGCTVGGTQEILAKKEVEWEKKCLKWETKLKIYGKCVHLTIYWPWVFFFLLTQKRFSLRFGMWLPYLKHQTSGLTGTVAPASHASRCFRGKPRDLPMYQPAKMMSHAAPKTMTNSIPRNFKNCELFYGSNFSIFSS